MFAPLTAAVLFNRYYSTRSFLSNDRFLIACACLYAAGKIVDSPKSAKDVFAACYRARKSSSPAEPSAAPPPELEDRAFADAARERLLVAERAVLYAVRFDVDIEIAYAPLVGLLSARQLLAVRDALAAGAVRVDAGEAASATAWTALFEASLDLARGGYASQLCIELEASAIAAGAIEAALHVTGLVSAVPPPPPGEREWWDGASKDLDELRRTAAALVDLARLRLEDVEKTARGQLAGEERDRPSNDLRSEVSRQRRDGSRYESKEPHHGMGRIAPAFSEHPDERTHSASAANGRDRHGEPRLASRRGSPHRDNPDRGFTPSRNRDAVKQRAAPRRGDVVSPSKRERDRSPPHRSRQGQKLVRDPADEYDALFDGW